MQDMRAGIVLGGGGILGGFQVGALKFLHEQGYLDDIACICGTSVGAINGAIVASDPKCWPLKLEDFWLDSVLTTSDLLGQQEWFSEFYSLFNKTLIDASRSRVQTLYDFVRDGARISRKHLFGRESGGWASIEQLIKSVTRKNSLYGTEVLKKRLDSVDIKPAVKSDIALRFYATNLKTGEFTCFANEAGTKNHHYDVLLTVPEKLVTAVLGSAAFPGVLPPIKMDGEHYVDGSLREVLPIKGTSDYHPLKEYIIPCLPRIRQDVRHRHMDTSTPPCDDIVPQFPVDWKKSRLLCVGMRSAEIILDEIVDSDMRESGLDPDTMAQSYNGPFVGSKNSDVYHVPWSNEATKLNPGDRITFNTAEDAQAAGYKSCDLCTSQFTAPSMPEPSIIDPLVAVHEPADLHVGLIKINMDQGYMRAFDEVEALSPAKYHQECCQLTRLITLQRVAIWRAEHELIERLSEAEHWSSMRKLLPRHALYPVDKAECLLRAPVDTTILYDIREMKKSLKECVTKRESIAGASSLPARYEDMWLKWEPHNWDVEGRNAKPFIETPWEPLDLGCRGIERIPSAPCPQNDH